jgi:hypothetical protein
MLIDKILTAKHLRQGGIRPVAHIIVAFFLIVPAILLDAAWGLLIRVGIVGNLRRRLIKFVLADKPHEYMSEVAISRNRAGSGGQQLPRFMSWSRLLNSHYGNGLHRAEPMAKREVLFFSYFGPLEHWCERHLSGVWYLWADDDGINIIVNDENDLIIWNLTWDEDMPKPSEIDSVIKASMQ